jgi:hypothetical protein
MDNNIPLGKQFNLDDIFANLPTEVETVIELPSKCKFYNSKSVTIRPMTFEDEKAMVLARKDKQDTINVILARCISGVDVGDLILIDKLYLILKLREISYGDNYSVSVNCGKCTFENKLNFKLSDLPISYFDDAIQEIQEITLPVTKVKVKIRYPRVSDEKYINDDIRVFDNLWRFVVEIQDSDDPVLISKFLKDPRVPLKDMHTITNAIGLSEYGVQTKVRYDCESCGHANVINLPLGADFFTVS